MPRRKVDPYYSPRQVKDKFLPGLSLREIYYLLEEGEISPAYRKGKRWLVPESSIHEFRDRLEIHEGPRSSSRPLRVEAGARAHPGRLASG